MQVDDGAKAAPEKFLNDGDDWLTIIEGSQEEIPQDHWGIGASIKVRLDGDRLVISADEPGYSESISLRIPALTTRPEPAAAGDDLDAMLNNIHPNTTASLQFIQPYLTTDPEPYWQAHVSVPTGGLTGFQKHRGTGPTRKAAILDAVRKAKENGDG